MAPTNQYDETLQELKRAGPPAPALTTPAAEPTTSLAEEYRETLRLRTEGRAGELRATMQQAVTQTPERAARAAQLAARLGLPISLVERDFDAIEQRSRVEATEYTRLLKETPTLAAWLTANPSHAAVAQAEIPQLSQVERVLRAGIDIRRGVDQVLGLGFSATEWLGEATGDAGLRATGRAGRELSAISAAQYGPAREVTDVRSAGDFGLWLRDVVGDQIPILAVTAPSAYAGAALGTMILPGIGTTIGGVIGALVPSLVLGIGEVQQGVKERGEDQSAPLAVFIGGSAIAAFDSVLPGHIGTRMLRVFGRETAEQIARKVLLMPVKQSMLREAGKELATEGFTEALQEAIGEAATDIGTGERFDPLDPELWRRMINAGAAGALVGGLAGGGGRVIEDTLDRKARQAAAAQYGGNVLNSITAALKDTEIAARLPGAVEAFVGAATQGGALEHVYVRPEFWTQYWQSKGQDPAALAAVVTGDAKAYETAVATNQELVIPLARYAMAIGVTEHHAAFAPEIAWRPGEMNMREAAAWQAEQAAATTAAPPAAPATDPHTEAHVDFVAQLVRAGYTPEVAETHARVQEAMLRKNTQRAGIDPEAVYRMYGLEVTRPGVNLESDVTLGLSPSAVPVQPVAPGVTPEGLAAGHMPVGPTVQPATGGTPLPLDVIESLGEPVPATPAGERRGPDRVETPETDALYTDMRAALDAQMRANMTPEQIAQLDALSGREVDTGAAPAETEEGLPDDTGTEGLRAAAGAPGRPAVRRIETSTPLKARESARDRESRRTRHYAAVFNELKRAAQALDPTVDLKALRAEFNDRVQMLEELDQEWAESGQNPRTVLQAIADAGGISLDYETQAGGRGGELRWVRESPAFGPFGTFAGVRGVFRQHQAGSRGGSRVGLALDDMTTVLQGRPEFAWIEDQNDLLAVLEDVARLQDPTQLARTANFPGTEELRRRAGMNPAVDWWRPGDEQQFFQAPPAPVADPAARKAELEQLATDEAMGVEFPEGGESTFPDGSAAVVCTNCAERMIALAGNGEVYGWEEGTNPTSVVAGPAAGAQLDQGEGHDFAVIDGRFLVDAWAKNVQGSAPRAVFDLRDPEDRVAIAELYGDPSTWMRREETEGGAVEWVPEVPLALALPIDPETVDTLDTGEQQPRLPGAGAARQVGAADTRMRAPVMSSADFALTPEGAPVENDEQLELFQGPAARFRPIARFLTDVEQRNLKTQHAQTVLDRFKEHPRDMDFIAAALAGKVKRGWYRRSGQALLDVFGPNDAPRFIALLAALSPRVLVEQNFENAMGVWDAWDRAGRPTDAKTIKKVLGKGVFPFFTPTKKKPRKKVLDSWTNNVVRALSAEDPTTTVLSGPKVHSFYRNLMGDLLEVTNDAWVAAFANVNQKVFAGKLKGGGTDPGKRPGYLAMNARWRRVAEKLTARTGEPWTPAEVQETVWSWTKTLYEAAAEPDATMTAEEMVRAGALSDEAIAGTPDFATLMTGHTRIRGMLEAAGYGDALATIEETLGARAADPGAGPAPGAGSRAGGEDRSLTLANLRSARRLDALRERRRAAGQALNPDDETELFQSAPAPAGPMFYSRLVRAVEGVQQNTATGAQWKAMIKNAKIGVNQDEFAYARVDDLEHGTAYTKEQVLNYLRANLIDVEDVTLQGEGRPSEDEVEARAAELLEEYIDFQVNEFEPEVDDVGHAEARYNEDEEQWEAFVDGEDVGGLYATEEGALDVAQVTADNRRYEAEEDQRNDYRERLEDRWSVSDFMREAQDEFGSGDDNMGVQFPSYVEPGVHDDYREVFLTTPAVHSEPVQRLAALTESDRSVLVAGGYREALDEIEAAVRAGQLDHARQRIETAIAQSRNAAFVYAYTPRVHEQTERERVLLEALADNLTLKTDTTPLRWEDGHTEYEDIQNPVVRLRFDTRATSAGQTLFLEEVQTPAADEFAQMPALLQKNWRQLAFKWALRYAADHGFDAIAWTTGAQQAARYSLEKEVKDITWSVVATIDLESGEAPQTREVTITPLRGNAIRFDVDPRGVVTRAGTDTAAGWIGAPLENVIGKELAAHVTAEDAGKVEGEGLKVGGEGLKRLYDVDFKNVVNNLPAVKKHGGRVTTVTLQRSGTEQPALLITPELRDAVLGGQTLFQSKLDPDGRYQADLFGAPLETAGVDVEPAAALPGPAAAAGAPGVDVQSAAALQRDDVEGTFPTRTHLVTTRPQQLGAAQVTTPEQAAQALGYLSAGAQERFDVLVTDADGIPLAVVGSFKGRVDATATYPDVVVAEAFRISGAASVWLAHNHPSGDPVLSPEDRRSTNTLARLFRDTGITMRGGLVIGEGQFAFYDPATATETAPAPFSLQPDGPVVPVVEREFATRTKLSRERITSPAQAIAAVKAHAGDQFGVLLLDTKHQPIGFLPVDPVTAGRLRQDNRLDWLYRGLSIAGASNAIISAPSDSLQSFPAAHNLANALGTVGIQTLDIVTGDSSVTQRGVTDLGMTGEFLQKTPADKRGSIRFGPNREFTITLGPKADLSTLIHELGHFYFEMFGDLVDHVRTRDPETWTAGQRELVADYETLLAGLGVTTRAEIETKHHEQFAESFEKYLWTGEAPSPELRSAFVSFKTWLREVYASLRQIGGFALTPEIRGVFDRMLASDDAIAAVRAEGTLAPMFTDARSAGMSDAEFANYRKTVEQASTDAREQLDRQLLAEVRRERAAAWQAERAAVRDQVADEVQRQPVYQALFAMQRGTYPNGVPIETDDGEAPARISRQAVVAQFNKARARTLPRGVLTSGPGLDPQTAADLYGFASGDAFLTALATARPMATVIDEETDRRMRETHGSILLDGSLFDRAQAASANDAQETIARAELAALDKLRRQVRPHVQTAVRDARKEQAYERRWLEAEAKLRIAIAEGRKQVEIDRLRAEMEAIRRQAAGAPGQIRASLPPAALVRESAVARVAATKIRDLQPHLFWAAAARANKAAIAAAARQDLDAAVAAQQQYLVNLALYREATKQLDEVARRVERAKGLGTVAARKRLGLADQSYLDQVDGILDRFEFATVSRTVLDRRANILKWVAALEGENLPVDLPELVLEEARRVNYRELTVDELVAVTDGLQQIVHLAQLKARLLKAQEGRALHAVASELAASIRASTSTRRDLGLQAREPKDARARAIEGFFAAHRKMASLAYQLDGFVDGGPMATAIMFPLNEAGSTEAAMNADATSRLAAIVERAYPGKEKSTLYQKHDLPAVGKSLPKMSLLMVALNWGNEGNRQRLRSGYALSDAQIQEMLDTLDARDWQFVQDIWDFLDSYWVQIKAKQERVFGVAPEKVPAAPFVTRFGPVRGGYFPLRYDDTLSPAAAQNVDLEGVSFQRQAAYVNATTKRGHTEARAEKVTLPVLLDFRVITDHVRQVVHDLSHHEALIDVGRVLGHKLVRQAIYETYGDQVYRQFTTGVRDVALGDKPAANGFERAMNHVRTGTTVAGLGWNVTTAFLQPLGLTQSMARIGSKWVGVGLKRWLRDSAHMENTVVWISEKSEFMRTRFLTQQRELNEIKNQVGVNTGKLSGWVDEALSHTTFDVVTRQGIADSYFYLIGVMQRVADVPTWIGQYEKSMAAGETEDRAILIADQAVLDAQAGGQTKDLAAVQRGGPLMKLWTNFYSFFSATYNLAAEARAKRGSLKQPAELGRLAVDYLLLFTIPATLGYLVRAMMGGTAGDEEDWLEALARENISYMMGSLLGLRELSGTVKGYYGYSGPAGARVFASGANLVRQIEQAEIDAGLIKALNETAGALFHYPAGQAWRSLTGLAAIVEGKTTNPGVLVVGPPKDEE